MSEQTAIEALQAGDPSIAYLRLPGEDPRSPLLKHYGVYVGSHGGRGRTLRKAMKSCLMCCGLGGWWKTEDGEMLRDAFDRIAREHLGGPLYRRDRP